MARTCTSAARLTPLPPPGVPGGVATPEIPLFIGEGANGELEGRSGNKKDIGAGDGVMIAGDVRTLARGYRKHTEADHAISKRNEICALTAADHVCGAHETRVVRTHDVAKMERWGKYRSQYVS